MGGRYRALSSRMGPVRIGHKGRESRREIVKGRAKERYGMAKERESTENPRDSRARARTRTPRAKTRTYMRGRRAERKAKPYCGVSLLGKHPPPHQKSRSSCARLSCFPRHRGAGARVGPVCAWSSRSFASCRDCTRRTPGTRLCACGCARRGWVLERIFCRRCCRGRT